MKILIFGHSGSGKSTRARALAAAHGLVHLDLDSIVWEPGQVAVPRSAEAINASLGAFIESHRQWVIEGCYGERVARAAAHGDELVFSIPAWRPAWRTTCAGRGSRTNTPHPTNSRPCWSSCRRGSPVTTRAMMPGRTARTGACLMLTLVRKSSTLLRSPFSWTPMPCPTCLSSPAT